MKKILYIILVIALSLNSFAFAANSNDVNNKIEKEEVSIKKTITTEEYTSILQEAKSSKDIKKIRSKFISENNLEISTETSKFYKKVKNLSNEEEKKYKNLEKSIINGEQFVQVPLDRATSYSQGDVEIVIEKITGFSKPIVDHSPTKDLDELVGYTLISILSFTNPVVALACAGIGIPMPDDINELAYYTSCLITNRHCFVIREKHVKVYENNDWTTYIIAQMRITNLNVEVIWFVGSDSDSGTIDYNHIRDEYSVDYGYDTTLEDRALFRSINGPYNVEVLPYDSGDWFIYTQNLPQY
jgi:hypothetical protein